MAEENDNKTPESSVEIDADLTSKKKADEVQEDPRKGLPASVRVETGAPMQLKQADPNASGPWIQYNGVATVRTMSPEDWKAAGVECDDYHEWNYLNHKRIPRKAFSDEQLQYLLRVDGRFSLVHDEAEKADKTSK